MIEETLQYAKANETTFLESLKRLVQIPSVSFPGFDPRGVMESAEAMAGLLRFSGLQNVEILRIKDAHPYVYGEWLNAPGKPTLLLYAHHDVQPAGRENLWKSPPFEATERGGRLYGRGTADDKCGAVIHTSAIRAYLKTVGQLPLNVKMIIEGEEEIGSPHLEEFLKTYRHKMSADAMILTDTGNYDTGIPSITTSLRGIASLDLTVRSADHPLHSGMWGGPLVDPVQALSKMIASLTDSKGRMTIPGIYLKVQKPSRAEEKSLRSLKYTEKDFRKQAQILPQTRLLGDPKKILESLWRRPSLSVNAIQSSSRQDCANIINESAWCHIGVRLAPGMNPKETLESLKKSLLKSALWGVQVEFSHENASPAWMAEAEGPAFQAAARALEKGFGRKMVFVGCGGSIPFVGPFSKVLGGAAAILIGAEDPYTNPHSENESLHLGDFFKSIQSAVHLYAEMSSLPTKILKAPAMNRQKETVSI